MAVLSKFKQDYAAIQQGEWVLVGEEYDDLEILSKGLTDAYFDAQAAKMRAAARSYGNNVERVPSFLKRKITTECLINHVFLDVRNLWHDDEKTRPVSKEEFIELIQDPDYAELLVAVMRAAGTVGQQHKADLEEAVGNLSAPLSATSPATPAPQNGSAK